MVIYRLPNTDYRHRINVVGVDSVVVGDILGNFIEYLPVVVDADWGGSYVDLSSFAQYDKTIIISAHDTNGNVLLEETIEIVRPYATPTDGEDADAFYANENVARAIIDSLTGGFYFRRKIISFESKGGDIIPLHSGVVRILRAWENGVKVFDPFDQTFVGSRNFGISSDRTSIVVDSYPSNRFAGNDTALMWSPSDYMWYPSDGGYRSKSYRYGAFPAGHDYLFDVEIGYRFLPSDITLATKMLIDSGACADPYLNRHILEYDTDQYRIKYSADAAAGTGNRQVDMILSKYITEGNSVWAGVL